MTSELFNDAAQLIKAGRKIEARQKLLEYVDRHTGNERAWLWLAALMPELEERITALENAYTLNPRMSTKRRLAELQERKSKRALNGWYSDPYQEAVKAFREGNVHEAQQRLEQLLRLEPEHLQGWLGLSWIASNTTDRISALRRVLDIDPGQDAARIRLQKLLLENGNPVQLAVHFEEQGEFAQALAQYRLLYKEALDRQEKKRWRHKIRTLRRRIKKDKRLAITPTSLTTTWVRLAAGPILIFALLVFLHAGLSPFRWLGWMITAGFVVAAGSVLMIGAISVPDHPVWQQKLGKTAVPHSNKLKKIAFLGVVLTYTPFLILLLSSLSRLVDYRELLLSTVGG